MTAATVAGQVLGAEPYTPADWVLIIGAITTAITTTVASVTALVVSIRNGKTAKAVDAKVDGVQSKVDEVHDCLHSQAADIKSVITNQADVKAALADTDA